MGGLFQQRRNHESRNFLITGVTVDDVPTIRYSNVPPTSTSEGFNLFNSANVSQINPVFGSGLAPIPGFNQPIAGSGARQVQFSVDFEF